MHLSHRGRADGRGHTERCSPPLVIGERHVTATVRQALTPSNESRGDGCWRACGARGPASLGEQPPCSGNAEELPQNLKMEPSPAPPCCCWAWSRGRRKRHRGQLSAPGVRCSGTPRRGSDLGARTDCGHSGRGAHAQRRVTVHRGRSPASPTTWRSPGRGAEKPGRGRRMPRTPLRVKGREKPHAEEVRPLWLPGAGAGGRGGRDQVEQSWGRAASLVPAARAAA